MPATRRIPKARTPAEAQRRRDYNSREHKQERARRVAASTPSTPCTRCGHPLGRNTRRWHLPHRADRTGYEPGLWCAPCNQLDAAQRGGRAALAIQRARRDRRPRRLTW